MSKTNEAPSPSRSEIHTPNFTYRNGSINDVPDIVLVEEMAVAKRRNDEIPETIKSDHEVTRLKEAMKNPETWSRLVYDEEKLAGFILGYPAKDPDTQDVIPNREHISLLMIHPDYWGMGIGGSLLDWTFDETRSRGAKEISLWTETDNPRSRPLYERKGFELTGKTRLCPAPFPPDPQVHYLKIL